MKYKYDISPSTKVTINNLRMDIDKLYKAEFNESMQSNLRLIQKDCLKDATYNRAELLKWFKDVSNLDSENVAVSTAWKNQSTTLNEKAVFLANYITNLTPVPSVDFIKRLNDFIDIIKTDTELAIFLKDPQKYINENKKLTSYQLHILQLVINDPVFNAFSSINRQTSQNTYISAPVTAQMYHLNLPDYGSSDATRFPHCINPDVQAEVLAKSKKLYHGPQVMGMAMGALTTYNRASIANTADTVKRMKSGACHNFAQLAADHFLTLMESGQMNPVPIKMVSHKAALGSHTLLLLDHTGDDLTDLSNCLIVDPWAVVMGHNQTYGVFTQENYPFPGMLTNLVSCFDTQKPLATKSNTEVSNATTLAREGLFARTTPKTTLSRNQQTAVMFLTNLAEYIDDTLHNTTRKQFVEMLIDQIINNDLSPSKAIKMATMAACSRTFEKIDDNNYSWKGIKPIDESMLINFNEKEVLKFWAVYTKGTPGIPEKVTTVNPDIMKKILIKIDAQEEHEFNKSSTVSLNK